MDDTHALWNQQTRKANPEGKDEACVWVNSQLNQLKQLKTAVHLILHTFWDPKNKFKGGTLMFQ